MIPFGAVNDRPEYDWTDGVDLRWYAPAEGETARVRLPGPNGETAAVIELTYSGGQAESRVVEGTCGEYKVSVIADV